MLFTAAAQVPSEAVGQVLRRPSALLAGLAPVPVSAYSLLQNLAANRATRPAPQPRYETIC